ncbi:MAG: response regulator [Candidatus Paceibacterota bacterium]|jgi:DNA-binding response OmpR family regulator
MQSDNKVVCSGQKIVVITNDAAFGDNIHNKLVEIGYEVKLLKEGNEGLKAMYDVLPHLALIDVDVPGLSGYDILEKKQAEPLLAKIPVFLMSTQGVPINMRRVPEGSVNEFIVSLKADVEDVSNRVNKHFGCVPKSNQAKTGEVKRILWVEDDKLIGSILGKKLISSGFDLVHAKNGEEAMKELEQTIPNAMMIDLLLPGMTGFDILQKVRDNPRYNDLPIMILSNLSKPGDINRTKVLGAQKFLVKATASLDQIIAEVRNLAK